MGEPERVRKAAHLLHILIPSGVISLPDVRRIQLAARIDGDLDLVKNLDEGIDAYLSSRETENIEEQNVEMEIVIAHLAQDLAAIDIRFSPTSEYAQKVSKKRIVWEKQSVREALLFRAAQSIAESKDIDNLSFDLLKNLGLSDQDFRVLTLQICLHDMQAKQAREINIETQKERWLTFCRDYLHDENKVVVDEVVKTASQCFRLGIISEFELEELGGFAPDLRSPLPVNLEQLSQESYQPLIKAVSAVKANPRLSELLFPVFLGIGSRVKGISGVNSDTDAALIWRPGITPQERLEAINLLKGECPDISQIDSMPELYTTLSDENLFLDTSKSEEVNAVQPHQIHFIFGGVWIGDSLEIQQLSKGLTLQYLDLGRLDEAKEEAQTHLIRRLELDNLLYRLCHKGFRRTYPLVRQRHLPGIDADSDFFQPEYRNIATLLFISRVFLPDLSTKKAPVQPAL